MAASTSGAIALYWAFKSTKSISMVGTHAPGVLKTRLAPSSIINPEDRVGIVLVPDFIDLFAALRSHVEAIGTVDNDAINFADIPVSMHDALGNDHGFWIVGAGGQRHHISIGGRVGAIVPHAYFEI